ncbi:185_t:CDS:2 [Gigaspora margarita]|uniref:185_t:CDS:1 n=1 Tax=Gigaspora margarita TaxID=4874 RepID=A0ABN7VMP6_GIGMA|nr:185_t:CDS:2 [Gigaspora margarita]
MHFKCDFPTFPISVGDFVLQKISENIISNWVETERKNKIKDARAQGIAPLPKRKNVIPPTSRFKKTTVQLSETNSNIAEVDDEIDNSLIASNENDSPSHYSITYNNTDIPKSPTITPRIIRSLKSSRIPVRSSATGSNSINVRSFELNSDDDDISEPSTATPHTMRSSRSSKVLTKKLSAISSKAIEVDDSSDYNDTSELSNVTSHKIKLSTPSRIPTQLSTTSSNTIEAGNYDINNDNDTSEFFTVSPLARRSSRSSNSAQLSASSKTIGVDNLTVNNDNDISESSITTSRAMRSSRSSKISTQSSASSNRVEINDTQSFGLPLSPVEQNENNIGMYLYKEIEIYYKNDNN